MSDLKVGSLPAVTAAAIAAADPKAASAQAASAHAAQPAAVDGAKPASVPAAPMVQTSAALDPGEPPVDTERVAKIRSAIASGHYPLVPARIGDAMIAAGILLRSGKD